MVKLKWNTKTQDLSKEDLYALGYEIFYYCRNVLGMKPKGNVYPYLHIYPRKKAKCYGEYSSYIHLVEIYPSQCHNLRMFVDTVIHEYTHSCQSWFGKRYSSYTREFGYYNNPFEIEARKVAKENRAACIEHLKGIFE